jgi:PAS domain S-box-containing protein
MNSNGIKLQRRALWGCLLLIVATSAILGATLGLSLLVNGRPEVTAGGLAVVWALMVLSIAGAGFALIRQLGRRLYVEQSLRLHLLDLGGKDSVLPLARDISERRRSQNRIAELLSLNQMVVTKSQQAILAYRATGPCVLANPAAARVVGATVELLLGQNFRELDSWRQSGLLDAAERALATDTAQHLLATFTTSFGRRIWIDCDLATFSSCGEPHVMLVAADVTEQRRLEADLQAAKSAAEAASRAKSEFLANMSHEIRTPMNAIVGLSYLLEQEPLDQRPRDYVEKVRIAATSLLGILNDILDFSKIEAGRMELESIEFSLDEVLRNIAATLSTNARSKGIETVIAIDPAVPRSLKGDPLRLQQVLLNLTGNALKFTDAGEVVVSVTALRVDAAEVVLDFSVRDTGIGIPADKQGLLFQAFSQADPSTTRRFGGTGLGLAICTRLVSMMKGTMSLDSEAGRGSDFRFTALFGQSAQPAPVQPAVVPEELGALSVLVVDDNDTARQVIERMCTAFGWAVDTAASGEEAITALERKREAGRTYDVMLVDWRMPGMDGLDLLKRLESDGAAGMPTAILLVTAYDSDDLRRRAGRLHLDAVLAKPVTPSMIFDGVVRVLTGIPASKPTPVGLAGRLQGLRLLLVDDNEINQDVARDILERAGASVVIADDGAKAVTAVENFPDAFDAVLMDIQMPGMDGYQATQAIRGRLARTELPIIAMTANAMTGDREKCLAAGMNDHIAKPIDVERLISVLKPFISCSEGGGGAEEVAADISAPALGWPEAMPGLRLAEALERLCDDEAKLLALLLRLVDGCRETAVEVREFLASADPGRAAQALHRLRGGAANLGAADVASLAGLAEVAIKGGNDDAVPGLLAELDDAVAVLTATVASLAETANKVVPAPAEAELSPAQLRAALDSLCGLLRQNNMAAVDAAAALQPSFAAVAGAETADRLGDAVAGLDFAAALDILAKELAGAA